jgi:hypothetical protein
MKEPLLQSYRSTASRTSTTTSVLGFQANCLASHSAARVLFKLMQALDRRDFPNLNQALIGLSSMCDLSVSQDIHQSFDRFENFTLEEILKVMARIREFEEEFSKTGENEIWATLTSSDMEKLFSLEDFVMEKFRTMKHLVVFRIDKSKILDICEGFNFISSDFRREKKTYSIFGIVFARDSLVMGAVAGRESIRLVGVKREDRCKTWGEAICKAVEAGFMPKWFWYNGKERKTAKIPWITNEELSFCNELLNQLNSSPELKLKSPNHSEEILSKSLFTSQRSLKNKSFVPSIFTYLSPDFHESP